MTNHYSARLTRVDWNDDWIGGPALGRAWTFTPSASVVLVRQSGMRTASDMCADAQSPFLSNEARRWSAIHAHRDVGGGPASAIDVVGTGTR